MYAAGVCPWAYESSAREAVVHVDIWAHMIVFVILESGTVRLASDVAHELAL